jgi:hypothetical protein
VPLVGEMADSSLGRNCTDKSGIPKTARAQLIEVLNGQNRDNLNINKNHYRNGLKPIHYA